MNRRKKARELLDSRNKKASAKVSPKNKPRYISKAERAKLEAEQPQANNSEIETKKASD